MIFSDRVKLLLVGIAVWIAIFILAAFLSSDRAHAAGTKLSEDAEKSLSFMAYTYIAIKFCGREDMIPQLSNYAMAYMVETNKNLEQATTDAANRVPIALSVIALDGGLPAFCGRLR